MLKFESAMTLLPVLAYHAVGSPLERRFAPWTVSEEQLSEQLAALREAGYRLTSLTAALHALDTEPSEVTDRAQSRGDVVVTFDDGYADFAEAALPVLLRHQSGATLFVVTDLVGQSAKWLPFPAEQRRPLLSWSDLEGISAHDIEIGSHGCRHLELDAVSPEVARDEIERSRRAITDHLSSPACFAYPFGYHSASVRRMVARAGYSAACEVGRGLYCSSADRMRIRRLLVQASDTPDALLRRLAGPEQLRAARLREFARPAWRTARRARKPIRSLKMAFGPLDSEDRGRRPRGGS
jgi:peptidoglycan/xylan/chitin deacetylase (PgdA/CDA1 family)